MENGFLNSLGAIEDIGVVIHSAASILGDTGNLNPYRMTKHIGEAIVRESDIPEKLIIQLPKMIEPYVHMEDTTGLGFLTMTKRF